MVFVVRIVVDGYVGVALWCEQLLGQVESLLEIAEAIGGWMICRSIVSFMN